MVAASLLWTLLTRAVGVPDPQVGGLWLPAYLDWFALGMGLAVLRAWHDASGRLRVLDQLGDAGGTCWAVAAAAAVAAATPLGGPRGLDLASPGEAVTKHLLYGVLAVFLLLPGGVRHRPPLAGAPGALRRPVRWLGQVSYGVFLWHLLVLELVFRALRLRALLGRPAARHAAVVLPAACGWPRSACGWWSARRWRTRSGGRRQDAERGGRDRRARAGRAPARAAEGRRRPAAGPRRQRRQQAGDAERRGAHRGGRVARSRPDRAAGAASGTPAAAST